jgi:sedoheptulose-bisphosphatase
MMTLQAELGASSVEPQLASVVLALAESCADIAAVLRAADSVEAVGSQNPFGDAQLAADLRAHDILVGKLSATGIVATVSSEESPVETSVPQFRPGASAYSVCFDPCDGSSVYDANFAVGTIFGVFPGNRLIGQTGRDLVCGGCAVYGPRTTLYLAITGWPCTVELTLSTPRSAVPDDVPNTSPPALEWRVTRRIGQIMPGTTKLKLFAPANLRATQDHPGYAKLVAWYMANRYTLRYTGGMVPDVCQLLVKGVGVYTSPASAGAPSKLRLLYEALPMALLVECAGGASSDGTVCLLDRTVLACDERTPVCLGSSDEVARFATHCPV